jgi:thymidylate synthase (FAD)
MIELYNGVGFINLEDHMGDDLAVVNAARVSMGKRSTEFSDRDEGLIEYLAKHQHHSPFRHVTFKFHCKLPEFIARQFYKHIIGSDYAFKDTAFNEISGRYVEFSDEHWSPDYFRAVAPNVKQGSSDEPIQRQGAAKRIYEFSVQTAFETYAALLDLGVCKEQARAVLPLSFMTEFIWTASLQAVVHFVKLRSDPHAQKEIRDLAAAMLQLIEPICPVSVRVLTATDINI